MFVEITISFKLIGGINLRPTDEYKKVKENSF
jgi:hypothetical protein